MSIKSIPDNQGWSAGGYNFYVAEDGSLTKGRPGETPVAIAGSLPDGATIGGVMYFNRPTKPTERSAGVPLVIGDRWYKTDDGTEWFWNGTYWLSTQRFLVQGASLNVSGSNSYLDSHGAAIVLSDFNSIFVERTQIVWEYASYSLGNYWQFQVNIDRGNTVAPTVIFLTDTYNTTSGSGSYEQTINTAYTFTSDYPLGIRMWAVKVGSPGNASVAQGYRYRLIAP